MGDPQQYGGNEGTGPQINRSSYEGAKHIHGPMSKIDKIHDAERERKAGSEKKKQYSKLNTVDYLLN